jgi:hypothetical protein
MGLRYKGIKIIKIIKEGIDLEVSIYKLFRDVKRLTFF